MLNKFRWLTAGESHGPGLAVIIEGMPAGVDLSEEYMRQDLARRQGGYGRGKRQQIETDWARIRSGVRHGKTMGSPVSLLIDNKDWENWHEVMSVTPPDREFRNKLTRLRPGHADTTGTIKYNFDDVRPVLERSSARETAARVAVGAVARRLLEYFGIEVHSHTVNIGGVEAQYSWPIDWSAVEESPVRCVDPVATEKMIEAIDAAREAGETVGGISELIATGVPIGLGSHVHWDRKLSTRLSAAVMSINAVKAVEFGAGFSMAGMRGSQVQDVIKPSEEWETDASGSVRPWQRTRNNSGGLEGGISSGEPITMRFLIKPIATLPNPLPSLDLVTGAQVNAHYERSDICQVPAGGVVGEAMMTIVLADALLEKFGGDHIEETYRNYKSYMETTGIRSQRE